MTHQTVKELNSLADVAELAALLEGLNNLAAYLNSSKFSVDTTVQVRDVLNRLDSARQAGNHAAGEALEADARQHPEFLDAQHVGAEGEGVLYGRKVWFSEVKKSGQNHMVALFRHQRPRTGDSGQPWVWNTSGLKDIELS